MLFIMIAFSLALVSSRALTSAKPASKSMKIATRLLSMSGGNIPDADKPFYALGKDEPLVVDLLIL